MIAKYLKVIAPVAIIALAVSAPAIAKDKQKNAGENTPSVEETQAASEQTDVAKDSAAEDAEEKVTEITIPSDGKQASKSQESEKSRKSDTAKKDSDRQKTAKKPNNNKKNDG